METEEYVNQILTKYSKNIPTYQIESIKVAVDQKTRQFAGMYLIGTSVSGSIAKGTNTSLSSDIDIFVSISDSMPSSVEWVFESMFNALKVSYPAVKRNVAVGITMHGFNVDVVPAKIQKGYTDYHWLYSTKKKGNIQTNVDKHVDIIKKSGRINEIKLTKIWSKLHKLDFPSFYLELVTIEALQYKNNSLPNNFVSVLKYLSEDFTRRRFTDPSNSGNIISDSLTEIEKRLISQKAQECLNLNWNQVLF
nr:nucleotidyltransferase [Candidatus Woesearchaeota archaeon]